MAEPSPDPDSPDDPGSTPRWVKVFGFIALVLILLVGVVMLTGGGGGHGPGRHAPPASVTEIPASSADPGGHPPPEGDQ
jgi:hypothetical protein